MVDDELLDGGSMNVETLDSVESSSIEACAKNLERFSCEEIKDDER